MAKVEESTIQIPKYIHDNEFIGAGLSAWVHRLDAVVKSFPSNLANEKDKEIAVYRRLGQGGSWYSGILRFYGILDDTSIVLQHAPYGSIRNYFRQCHSQPVPLSTKLRWAEQAVGAVAFLHSKNIFHCDLSCNNIFLDKDMNAVIGDFAGSSVDGGEFFSWYETSHSPPDIYSPSTKTEIFALGSVLYEIMTQEKPFQGLDEHLIEDALRRRQFPSLDLLPMLKIPITKCWNQQYETINELLQDIKNEDTPLGEEVDIMDKDQGVSSSPI
ncbi:unnamed protein product [Clonostachys solani]|uniref:EKC/KEOPS complex subunit BUD32 n=1 Tax=Clonostachys solani TaxID=160281 RepID=A0A9P0ELS1_9HYPO|nr:unnamed protein product [Clonostachys solani]